MPPPGGRAESWRSVRAPAYVIGFWTDPVNHPDPVEVVVPRPTRNTPVLAAAGAVTVAADAAGVTVPEVGGLTYNRSWEPPRPPGSYTTARVSQPPVAGVVPAVHVPLRQAW